jgi:uncharacterized protein YcbK (DUF882 family)
MRLALVTTLLAVAIAAGAGPAEAGRGKRPKGMHKICSTKIVGKNKKKKKVCRKVPMFSGHNASRSKLRVEPLEKPSGKIELTNFADEVLAVNIYRDDGSFDDAALAKLDDMFRCKRSHEVRAVDPRLYEMLSRIYDHFGGKRIDLVSGFRGTERESSRHRHASAMDFRIEGVSIEDLYDYAESLDMGGMGVGIYPTSQFIHFDYRAPGDPSYRWTDWTAPGSDTDRPRKATKTKGKPAKDKGKTKPPRTKPARKPTA